MGRDCLYANSTDSGERRACLNFGAVKEFTDRVPLADLNRRYGSTSECIVNRIRQARP